MLTIKRILPRLAFLLLSISCVAFNASAARKERLIDGWRPVHFDVALTLNQELSEVSAAKVDVKLIIVKPITVIDFDFGDMTVDSVTVDSMSRHFSHNAGKLLVELASTAQANQTLNVQIVYHGKPKDGLVLAKDKDSVHSAIGDNWPDRVHNWIPCLDHPSAKASVTFTVSVPADELVVANGQFVKVETNATGSRTWTYSEAEPIPPYCMIIGVGHFAQLKPLTESAIPLSYYVPFSDRLVAVKGFDPSRAVLHFLGQKIAPYPYEKLALIVGATQFGGMENSSAIVFPSGFFNPNPNAGLSVTYGVPLQTVNVVAHEIAHQWFGDSVTESTWSDLWLSEGFATYFDALFIQSTESEQAFRSYMDQAAAAVFAYEKANITPVHDRETQDLFKLLNANSYQKGAWVLHMLRLRLGDDAFFRGLRSYYQDHKGSTASSEDLRAALEKSSGMDLKSFFQRWIYETGHPQYELTTKWDPVGHTATLLLKQTQASALFADPVTVRINSSTESQDLTIVPDQRATTRSITMQAQPEKIEVDPANALLKEVTVLAVTSSK